MPVQCWSTVYDAGPTLNHHWLDVSCLLGIAELSDMRHAFLSESTCEKVTERLCHSWLTSTAWTLCRHRYVKTVRTAGRPRARSGTSSCCAPTGCGSTGTARNTPRKSTAYLYLRTWHAQKQRWVFLNAPAG